MIASEILHEKTKTRTPTGLMDTNSTSVAHLSSTRVVKASLLLYLFSQLIKCLHVPENVYGARIAQRERVLSLIFFVSSRRDGQAELS